jgi:uncharacterized RDD family membrane protein YckC
MGYVQEAVGPSVPPPGWTPTETPQAPTSRAPALVGDADAAVRWRISAAGIDAILMMLVYLLLCAVLGWQVASPGHVWIVWVLDLAYHFACEAHSGQTIGKRQYGLRVVSAHGGRAAPRAIAIRSLLRFVDALPTCYVSGLVTMMRTGPARRQRIGDIAGQTMVVAVEGRALNRGTPGWMLPSATVFGLLMSALLIFGVAHGSSRPLTVRDRDAFIIGCERSAMAPPDACACVLTRLEANGYTNDGAMRRLFDNERRDAASGTLGPDSRNMLEAMNDCRIPTPAAPGPIA